MARSPSPALLKFVMNLWPPFLGAGIKVRHIAHDFREVRVELPLSWRNRNYVRAHFGGSLYAMTDPFFMLMVMRNLSSDYRVWDKSATIDYVAPGRGTVRAVFALSDHDLEQIHAATAAGDKHLHLFRTEVCDEQGLTVARIEKIVYVRKKQRKETS